MPRNLDRIIELLVPIETPTVKRQMLEEIMEANLRDTLQSWYLQPDRTYLRVADGDPFAAHRYFISSPSLSGQGSGSLNPRTPT
jgi:polyphosphate kinase